MAFKIKIKMKKIILIAEIGWNHFGDIELAKKMINLSGLKLKNEENKDDDIEIIYSGKRPGEKLFEELLIGENVMPTKHSMIMKANESFMNFSEIKAILSDLDDAVSRNEYESIRSLLIKAVPEFNPEYGLDDIVYLKDIKSKLK